MKGHFRNFKTEKKDKVIFLPVFPYWHHYQSTNTTTKTLITELMIPSGTSHQQWYRPTGARCTYVSATSFFRSTKIQTIKWKRLMSRRRQTNIPNPTNSNRQDPQHISAADIRYEMHQCALTHPKPSNLNWHDPWNPTAQCTRQTMATVSTPQLSRKITQMMVSNS